MKLLSLKNFLKIKIIRIKLLNNTFLYNRAQLINKILKAKRFKEIYLIILIKLISKLFKNRIDYFDVKILLNGIADQYKLKNENSKCDLQPLIDGLYNRYDSKMLEKNKEIYSQLLKTDPKKRSFHFQSEINFFEHKLNGASRKWYKFQENFIKLFKTSYPNLNEDQLFLGPNWYEAIGHIALLGYLAKVYPNKFTLIMVDGSKVANIRLLNTIKPKLKIIKSSPLIFNSLLISQPEKVFLVDDTRFCDKKDPAIELVNKWTIKSKSHYKLQRKKSYLKDILDCSQLKNHDIKNDFITLHVRSSPNENSNFKESSVRNADIFSYLETIRFLIKNNLNVVRIGDLNSPKLPYINGFIDLTLNERDLNNDIDLLVNAKFHLGTLSGPINVPPLFGVPVLLTNSVRPHLQPLFPLSLSISKRCFSKKDKSYMSYDSFIKSKMSNEEMKRDFGDYMLIDNSPKEILSAVKDMLILTNYKSNKVKKREYKIICQEYKKYLESTSLEYLDPHLPIAPSFLKILD